MTGLLRHVHASLTGAGIRDMLFAAADEMAYDAASGLAPYRVLLGSAPSVAASLVGRGEAVFLVSCRSVVVDGDAYGNALARVAGAAGVSGGGCGDGAGGDAAPRSTLPVFIPPWPPAVPAAVAAWANASSTVSLPSLLATASIPCRSLPPLAFASARTAGTTPHDPAFISADALPRHVAVRALMIVGAWRGTPRDARAAWSGGGREVRKHVRVG